MQLLTRYIWLFFLLVGMPFAADAKNDASTLFQKFKRQVFQIRVVDIASGDKNTIGSAFQVSKEGHLLQIFTWLLLMCVSRRNSALNT